MTYLENAADASVAASGPKDRDEHLADQLAEWYVEHAGELGGKEVSGVTASGNEVMPVYTPLDAPSSGSARYAAELGLPGHEPFTRGVRAAMYRERMWVMGQYSGQSTPAETNRRIRALLAGGQRGFSIALDLPTQNGYDSDHPLAQGEVGRVGVPIDTLQDMEDLLQGIDLSEVAQVRTTANAIGPIAVALFVVAAEKKGASPKDFKVMLQNDVLKEYIARGTFIFPPEHGLEFSIDTIEYCARHLPHWEPIEFCGYHVRDAGATAVQELGIAFANGIEYLDGCLRRGLRIDEFAHSAYMFLSASIEVFEEAAKFRAARRIWARLMSERYGATSAASKALNIFAYTLGGALSAQEPLNNISRVAYQALAAALGGVQTLATSSFDEALGIPSEFAARLALRTQQVLAYETGITRTADPLGGSYYIESLTDQLEHRTNEYLERLRGRGGILAAIASGELQAELAEEAYKHQLSVEDGRTPVIGLNTCTSGATDPGLNILVPHHPINAEQAEADQIRRLAAVKQSRDRRAVARALEALRQSAQSGENTVPAIINSVRAYASIGEICSVLVSIWGRHQGSTRL